MQRLDGDGVLRPLRGRHVLWLVGLLGGLLLTAGPAGAAVDVAIRLPHAVLTELPTTVVVTLTPSPSPDAVVLTLRGRRHWGGTAVFLPSRQPEVTVTETTTLQVLGTQPGRLEEAIVLEASVGGVVVAAQTAAVVHPQMLTRPQALARTHELLKQELADHHDQGPAFEWLELRGSEYWLTIYFPRATGSQTRRYRGRIKLDAFTGAVKQLGGSEDDYR